MTFLVSRTSKRYEEKPCDDAEPTTVTLIDERPVDNPLKLPNFGLGWYADPCYCNHRVENGHIRRDYKVNAWKLEINTLEELLEFFRKHGDLILTECGFDEIEIELEIYDDFRE